MSSSSREYSPDWLRNHQPQPTTSIWTLSSSSSSSSSSSEASPDEKDDDQLPISSVISKRLGETAKGKLTKPQEPKSSVCRSSSDSEHELSEGQHPKDENDDVFEETSLKGASKLKSSKKRLQSEDMVPAETKVKSMTEQENADVDDLKVLERETTDEKQTGPYVIIIASDCGMIDFLCQLIVVYAFLSLQISSSRLPLVLADKVQRSKVLVECEGESIDLSGDLGSVGRVVISDSASGNQDMLLDLKGTIYKTTIMPSRTLCVVSFGQSEARIEAIMNDFIQLKPQSNVYEAETMVEGTLEGFSFDSEDEVDKHASRQMDENEGGEPQTNGKSRGKSEAAKKKGKTAVKRPAAKKVNKKKAPVTKKTKAKK